METLVPNPNSDGVALPAQSCSGHTTLLNATRQRQIQILIQHVTVTLRIKHEADGFLTHRSLVPWIEALISTCFIVTVCTNILAVLEEPDSN